MNEIDCVVSSCMIYDLSDQSRESHFLPPISQMKAGSGAVVYDNTSIVVLGGWNSVQNFASVEIFDRINDMWGCLAIMPIPRCVFAVGVACTKILAAGGRIRKN